MFLEFFGMRQQPFGVTPDPTYLYPSRTHTQALASLHAGIQEGRGFLTLIAPPGMGKTTLLYQLLEELHDSARTAFIFQTQCEPRELFQYLLSELRIDPQGLDMVSMHVKLNEVLFSEMIAGRRFVLVVDEAQNLSDAVLETVRMLSNFETSHTKLLQIIIAGQPQLAGRFAGPGLAQLRQRIAVRCRLEPFSHEDTVAYINHRLKMAGYSGETAPFEPDALTLIAEKSQGIPRNINNICYNALAIACARERRAVDREIVSESLLRLEFEPLEAEALVIPSDSAPKTPPAAEKNVTSPLTYAAPASFRARRWDSRTLVLAGALLLMAMVVPAALKFVSSGQTHAEAPAATKQSVSAVPQSGRAQLPENYSADPEPAGAGKGQVITVAAMPQQTLKDISMLYVGRFDSELLRQITALNPDLTDPDHLIPGQLIKLPLPPGSFKKGEEISTQE